MVALNFEYLSLIQTKIVLKILLRYCLETKVEKLPSADALSIKISAYWLDVLIIKITIKGNLFLFIQLSYQILFKKIFRQLIRC